MSEKGLLCKIYKIFLKLNNKKQSDFSNEPKTLSNITPKIIQMEKSLYEKMLHIIYHQGNVNENNNETLL